MPALPEREPDGYHLRSCGAFDATWVFSPEIVEPEGAAVDPARPARGDRRGERVLAVPQKLWSCERCRDPDTGEAMRFVDASLGDANRALADAAWREHFGEPPPAGQKPGRKPVEPLDERVVAMLSKVELARLDAARGERSRSEFLRDAARRLVEAVEQQTAG